MIFITSNVDELLLLRAKQPNIYIENIVDGNV